MNATLCKTKAGKGLKIIVNDVWYYTSFRQFWLMMKDKANGCTFVTIEDDKQDEASSQSVEAPPAREEIPAWFGAGSVLEAGH